MSIYSKQNYRKIYEDHYGAIPVDSDGRTYDIHHIDGDHDNYHISNLKAVTIQEHFNIHYAQEELAACHAIKLRMDVSPEELSDLASKAARARVNSGNHPFVGSNNPSTKRIANGTHHFLTDANPTKISAANGTHHFIGGAIQKAAMTKRVEAGIHNFLDGSIATKNNLRRVAEGTHPSQTKVSCVYCRTECGVNNYSRHHGEKCKLKIR